MPAQADQSRGSTAVVPQPRSKPSVKSQSKAGKPKRIKRSIVFVSLIEALPQELLQVVLRMKADSLLVRGLHDDAGLPSRINRRTFLWKCCLVSKRFQAAAEPLLYADVLLRQLSPLGVPSPFAPLTEKSRYNAFVRSLALRPARRALVRSVEKAELGLDVVFLARTDLFPNLRRLGAVCWPAVHGPKGELQLMTQDDWRLMRWKLDKDREREMAGLQREEYLTAQQQLGHFPTESCDSASPSHMDATAATATSRPQAPKPALRALTLKVLPFAGDAQDAIPTAEEWFDLGALETLAIVGKPHPAVVPGLVLRAAGAPLVELRLEGWSANQLPDGALAQMLEAVGHGLRSLELTPLEPAAFPPEVLACCPRLETLSLNALPGEAFDALTAVGHGRLRRLFLGRRHDVVHVRSAATLSALVRSLGAGGRAFGELAAVGAHALHFGAPYGRAAAGVRRLGALAAEHGWTLVDGRGDVWDASWAATSEAGGGGGGGGDGGSDDGLLDGEGGEGWDVEVGSSDGEYDYRQDDWP